MSEAIITLNNVSFSYGNNKVLENISLCIDKGEFLGIVGPNGGGKSTLLKLILGLLKADSGEISIFGSKHRQQLAYVPQFFTFRRNFPIKVLDLVLMGRLGKTRPIGGFLASDVSAAEKALAETGLLELKSEPIGNLSGGQLQRALIARALAIEPKVLIMDEPTANIDPRGEEGIFEFLKKLNETVTVIIVSHDIGFVSRYVGRVACVNRTLVCHHASKITPELLESIYGGHMHMVHHHCSEPHTHTHSPDRDKV